MEVLSRKKRLQFIGHREKISCIALSRSGRLIVTGSESTTALVWDGTGLGSNAKAVDAKEFPALWNDLQSNDACQAHQAIWRFVLSQKQSLAWLKEKLPTVKAIDRKQMLRWIDQLDDASFQVRQNAVGHIQLAESRAKEPLEQALKQKPTLHQRRQIQLLLKKLRNPFQEPSVLRSARVIEIFAHMQSKESLQHLRHLATRGVPTSCITKLARRVLRSLR